jgi:hypothetical protein
MTYLAVVGYSVAFLAVAVYFEKREASFSSLTVFGLAAFLYYISIPLELAIGGADFFALSNFVVDVPQGLQFQIIVMGTIALVSFAFGYRLSGFRPFTIPVKGIAGPPETFPRHLALLVGVATTVLILFYRSELNQVSTYAGNYSTVYSSPLFSLLTEIVATGLVVTSATIANRAPRISILLLIPVVAWGIYSSDKDPMILALLGFAVRFVRPGQGLRWRPLIGSFLALVLAGPLLGLFSTFRAEGALVADDFKIAVAVFMLNKDPAGPMVSLVETITDDKIEFQFGATYVTGLTAVVPRVIWPDRPVDLSERFIRDRMQSSWRPGMGLAYSLLAEAYLNFGWLGPVIQYGLLGLLWGLAWKRVQRRFLPLGYYYWRATYCTIGYYTLIVMHRAPTSFPVKHSLMILGALFVSQSFYRHLERPMLARRMLGRSISASGY